MDPFCCDGICCALFAHLFIRNPYQLRFWSWCCRCIVTIWFDCPQVSWSARPTLIPRGGRSIPTAGIFLFNFWWPEINPWVHTFFNASDMVTLLICVVTTLGWHSEDSIPRGVLFFLFKWFGTALRCAFFNHWVDTPDTPERRGCFRWDLFWTPKKKNNFFNFKH